MAESERKPGRCPSPLGGAALRQVQGREHSHFSGPSLAPHDDSHGLWTQFSGMPNQPGSPTSLHEWLQSVDDASLSGSRSPVGARGFQTASSSSAAGSRSSPFDSFTAEFLNGGMGPDRARNAPAPPPHPQSSMGHHFDFGSPADFGSPSSEFGSPPDFAAAPHSPPFSSHSPVGHFSVSSSEMPGPPPDFSQPPPDYSFGAPPDFTRPPPSFRSDVPPLHPTADPHQGLSDFFAAHSKHSYHHHHQDSSLSGESGMGSSPPGFDAAVLASQSAPRPLDVSPGRIDVTLPPPSFSPFPMMADDILFQDSVDFDGHEQQAHVPSFESVAPAHRKVVRQNSEPVQGKAAAVEEGTALYVEALRRLNSFGPSGPSYEPFGATTAQPQEDPVETAGTFSDETPPSKHVKRKEPSKPSYSDMAKATKAKSAQSKADYAPPPPAGSSERGEPEGFSKTGADPSPPKPFRHQSTKRRYSNSRTNQRSTASSHSDSGGHGNYVQPNSRYGLDQFEDVSDLVRAEQRSSSVESLNSQVQPGVTLRRSSNSSLSSSASAVEEGHLGRAPSS